MTEIVQLNLNEIFVACRQHHVASISLFGSAAKNTLNDDSDVDFLVAFSDEIGVLEYADNYFSLKERLQEILNRKVDLVSTKSLKNRILKEDIYRTKLDLYAA